MKKDPNEQKLQEDCGKVSGNLEVLDVDDTGLIIPLREAIKGVGLASLIKKLPIVRTPSGGLHIYYRCTVGIESGKKLAERPIVRDDGKPGRETLLETRSEGNYVIIPSSPLECHPLKKPYELIQGDLGSIPSITSEERQALLNVAKSFDEVVEEEPEHRKAETSSVQNRPGDLFNQMASWDEILIPHGWQKMHTRGGLTYWKRPGKGEPGVSATTNYKQSGLLYVYSSNAYPFEAVKSFSKFGAYALLNHSGDHKAAALALGRMDEYAAGNMSFEAEKQEAKRESPWQKPSSEEFDLEASFPILEPEAFHGIAGEIVRAIEPHTEADPSALLLQFLVGAGNLIGSGPYTVAEGMRRGTNLFTIMVGKSSRGRKGTAWGRVCSLLKEVDEQWWANRIAGGLSSGEGLINAVRDPLEKVGKRESDLGVTDKRLQVVETEFGQALKVMDRPGNSLSAIIRNAFDSGFLGNLTKNSPLKATGAHISIIGHVTQDELRRLLSESECWNGFANRFLWGYVRRSNMLPEGGNLDPLQLAPLVVRLTEAVRFARCAGLLVRDRECGDLWAEVYPSLTRDIPGLLGAVTSRAEALTLRLSLIYALLDQSPVIRTEHLKAALAVCQYGEDSARIIFGKKTGDPLADRILALLRGAKIGEMTRTEISNALGNNQKAERIEDALDILKRLSLARCSQRETEGRTAEIWSVRGTKETN